MSQVCIMCGFDFGLSERIFEQRLIEDTDFCGRCFKEIITKSEAEELGYLDSICALAIV